MKIKNITRIISIFSFIFFIALVSGNNASAHTNAKMEEKWETSKSIKSTKKGIQYHAYISKDKKEAWIYKIKIKSKKASKLEFPSKIKGKKVTTIGDIMNLYPDDNEKERDDVCINILGERFEPWHSLEAKSNNKIVKIIVPNTVKRIACGTLAGFAKVKNIKLSIKMTVVESYQFYGDKKLKKIYIGGKCKKIGELIVGKCKSLKEIKFGSEINEFSTDAFSKCSSIKIVKVSKKNKHLVVKNNLLLTKNKKKLLLALSPKKKIKIPKGVNEISDNVFKGARIEEIWIPKSLKKIGAGAFEKTNIKKWHIASGSEFKNSNKCIYSSKTGELIYLSYASIVKMPEGITKIGASCSCSKILYKSGISKLYLPKNLKEINEKGWLGTMICDNLYFTSLEPPKVIKSQDYIWQCWMINPCIPKISENKYLEWLKENFAFDGKSEKYGVF